MRALIVLTFLTSLAFSHTVARTEFKATEGRSTVHVDVHLDTTGDVQLVKSLARDRKVILNTRRVQLNQEQVDALLNKVHHLQNVELEVIEKNGQCAEGGNLYVQEEMKFNRPLRPFLKMVQGTQGCGRSRGIRPVYEQDQMIGSELQTQLESIARMHM